MTVRHLDSLLEPTSVAVIGASSHAGSVGATVWRNLRAGSFSGSVWAVNPHHSQLDGQRVWASIAKLPEAPDLAVICTPAPTVAKLVAELGEHGTRAAIVMTAGLTTQQKQAVLDAARPTLLRVLGPNCLGLLVPHLGLNASFAHTGALEGDIAFVSQSGALVTGVLDWANARGVGFSRLISLGEHADVDFGDLLDWLASDHHTRSILLYIESIDQTRKFMSAARAAARNKPVILVKAGRAGNGLQAAHSHTGALAGSDIVFDAAVRRAGMLRVDTLAELFMAAETLARLASDPTDDLVIMSNGGGAGVMAADAAAMNGLPLPALSAALLDRLDGTLPSIWSRANPIDIIGDAPVERYSDTLRAVFDTTPNAAVLFMHAPTAIVRSDEIARACVPLVREHPGRVLACWLGEASVQSARALFSQAGAADYATPEEAIQAFSMLRTYRRNQALLMESPAATPPAHYDRAGARVKIERALQRGGGWLDETAAKEVLAAYGIPTVATCAVGNDDEQLASAAASIGFPLALKIRSPDITHKSDVGGVTLDIADAPALLKAAASMRKSVAQQAAQARIEGFSVQAMVRRSPSEELIVGASIDPVFGPIILFGAGGVAVEVDADRAIALPPLNAPLSKELIGRTRVARRLAGYRQRPAADQDAIANVLVAISHLIADVPELAELDINPLLADAAGVVALDARIRVDAQARGGVQSFAILPYPDSLEENVVWQGRAVVLRPIRPDDAQRHLAFIRSLEPADVRLRLFAPRRALHRGELERLTQIDYAREMAFVAVTMDGGQESTLGVARAVADPDHTEAEFSIIVRSDLKKHGLGRLLLDKLIRYCREQRLERLVGSALRENTPMIELARSLGFEVGGDLAARDDVRLQLRLTP